MATTTATRKPAAPKAASIDYTAPLAPDTARATTYGPKGKKSLPYRDMLHVGPAIVAAVATFGRATEASSLVTEWAWAYPTAPSRKVRGKVASGPVGMLASIDALAATATTDEQRSAVATARAAVVAANAAYGV